MILTTDFLNIEEWFLAQSADMFPPYNEQNEKSYPERYRDLKIKMGSIHDQVELGALVASFSIWRATLIENIKQGADISNISSALDQDPAIYLNQHGKGHVDKVVERLSMIIGNFTKDEDKPLPFEVFLLLSAAQIHDAGNVYGRDGHEKSFIEDAKVSMMRERI